MREELAMNRCGRLIFFALILAAVPAFGRTWTDSNGKKWEGDFVRVLRGKVLISVAGRTIPVPFGRLSPADQDFVRDILEKQGLGSQLPPRKNPPQSGTAAQPNTSDTPEKRPATEEKPKLGEERSWTDKQGRTIQARLIGMDGEKVVLQVKGKPLPYPFDGFSAADQEYVRKEMVARGDGSKVPGVAPPANVRSAPAPKEVAQVTPSPPPTTPKPAPPKPKKPKPPKPKPAATSTAPTPVRPPVVAAASHPPAVKPAGSSAAPSVKAPLVSAVPSPNPGPPVSASANPPAKSRICSNCKQKLPDDCKPGDHCPSCGTYLHYEDTDEGRVKAPLAFSSVGIPAGIASLVYAMAVGIARIGMRPKKR
jgi:hypothetical protein